MAVSLSNANNYLKFHQYKDKWNEKTDEEKQYFLDQAVSYISNSFLLREGTEETENYEHAVYEQAVHMLTFDKERFALQNQGVTNYKYEDIQVQMQNSIISPFVYLFLKKFIYKKVGEVI